MKSMKHTPGPWVLSYRDGRPVVTTLLNDTHPVAFVQDPYGSNGTANAQLIAAAPDLLEALSALQAEFQGIADGRYSEVRSSVLEQMDQAVAKATGGTNE